MTTQGGRRGLQSLVAVVAVAALAAIASRTVAAQKPPTGPVADQLAVRVARLMERDFRGEVTSRPGRVMCAALPFGTFPRRPADANAVETVYAWISCVLEPPRGQPVEPALMPVAVRFDRPPSIRVPARGEDRERSIRRIFPADVRGALRSVNTAKLTTQVTAPARG